MSEEGLYADGADGAISQRLKLLAARNSRIDVAQMQFIGIDALRAAYGDRWPAEKARVTAIATHYINKRIAPDDILIVGQDGFLLVFGSRTGEAAIQVSQAIADSLNGFFTGEVREASILGFESKHAVMSLDEIAGNVARANGIKQPPPPAVTQAQAAASFAAFDHVVYQPVWDARHEALTSYYTVVVDRASGQRVPGYQFDVPLNELRSFAELDELQLEASEKAIHTLFNQGKKALVGASLHINSLGREKTFTRLVGIASRLDAKLAPYRVVKIAGVPQGYPRISLDPMVRMLQARVQRISIGMHINEPDLASIMSLPVFSVGFALSERASDASAFSAHVMSRVSAGAALAHQRGKQFFVEGPISASNAEQLRQAGVDSIASPLIWKPCPEPDAVLRWPATNLVKG